MPERKGQYTVMLSGRPTILGFASVVGKREGEGPLGRGFDMVFEDTTLGEKSWEKAESAMQREAFTRALNKAEISPSQVNYLFAGDLLNQNIASTFGLREFGVPILGQFGACSTMAQTLSLAAIFVDSGAADICGAVTSSHFCSAERQFRFPLEYGGQRPPTAQWTVTGAGSIIVGLGGSGVRIADVTIGYITDLGITDSNNMGAAMAPAAAETIAAYLKDAAAKPDDFDLIVTGDLGSVGSDLLRQLMERKGYPLGGNYTDCGLLIYDRDKQDVHAGGSGCGCSAAVLCSYILGKMGAGELKNVLFIATGALMSPTSTQQGESIPGIAHLVHLVAMEP
ncbi:MAG: stage V sporulation protein AD [Oscillospiraceae bacterium]|nr:stage V sporulation protein AD [Oscillospiraceae bacterium]MDD4414553.1 stage V sporulation protein AD [Oscillospiraceae bacterium]